MRDFDFYDEFWEQISAALDIDLPAAASAETRLSKSGLEPLDLVRLLSACQERTGSMLKLPTDPSLRDLYEGYLDALLANS